MILISAFHLRCLINYENVAKGFVVNCGAEMSTDANLRNVYGVILYIAQSIVSKTQGSFKVNLLELLDAASLASSEYQFVYLQADPGHGKTVINLLAIAYWSLKKPDTNTLYVCPYEFLVVDVEEKYSKWFPTLKVKFTSSERIDEYLDEDPSMRVIYDEYYHDLTQNPRVQFNSERHTLAGIFGLPEGAAQLFISTAHNSKSFTEFLDKRFEDYEKVQVKNIKHEV